jgi:undecaprenyl-diphosphatase
MTLIATGPTAASQPVELPTRRVLLTVLGCALGVFVTVALLVHWQLTSHFDRALIDLIAAPKGSWAAHTAVAFTTLGDAVPLLTILVMAGVLAPVRWGGGWRLLSLPWASAAVAFFTASGIKNVTARVRPPASDWASPAHGFAFPSGHATTATAGYLVLAILVSGLIPVARHRGLVLLGGIVLALLVGASRVVLGVHWPTDVLAGWALGTAVAAATLAVSRGMSGASRYSAPAQEPPR